MGAEDTKNTAATPAQPTVESLQAEVDTLKTLVKRLYSLVGQTGQQVIQLQLAQRHTSVQELDSKNRELQQAMGHHPMAANSQPAVHTGAVTEKDLEELVSELQGQLTLLDDRSVRRVVNSRASKPSDRILPLPNDDGKTRDDFPVTVADFSKLSDDQLFQQWSHYEVLPGVEKLSDLLDDANTDGNAKVIREMYEGFAQYLGLAPPPRE